MRGTVTAWTGLALGAASLFVHTAPRAAELVLGAEASTEYDSNIFRTEDDPNGDGSAVFGPILRLREQHRTLRYNLEYKPSYEQYFTTDNISGLEQRLRADGTYDLSPRTQLGLKNNFYVLRSIGRQAFVTDLTLAPVVENTQKKVLIDEYGASVGHLFTPRLRGSFTFDGYLYEPEEDSPSSLTNGVDAGLLYSWTPRNRLGGGLGLTNQAFDQTVAEDTTTRFYRAYATWEHDFDPTFTFSIQAGPTWIAPEDVSTSDTENVQLVPTRESGGQQFLINPFTCPLLPDGSLFLNASCDTVSIPLSPAQAALVEQSRGDVPVTGQSADVNGSLTYFAAVNLWKRWETVDSSFGYRRTNGTTSGTGSSTINDSVFGTVQWRPDRLWSFIVTARWDRQKSASDVVVPVQVLGITEELLPVVTGVRNVEIQDAVDVKTTSVFLTAERRLTKRLFTFSRASWIGQNSRRENAETNSYDDFRVGIGLRYELDPIEVPFL